ncbi:MAG: hypothetical protein IJT77_14640 [Clostridia bacterium]|nr:hypothetical protein [Clostridia bacterium]
MALMHFDFQSEYLKGNTTISVILPDKPWGMDPRKFYEKGKKYKVLWLLHGTYGDHTDWLRKSNIELYACERDLVVVMPDALNSNYANWEHFSIGYNMYDYMTEELMPMVYSWLPVSDKRDDNYIAGLSMGGRGTCVYALNHPELFAGAAVLSQAPRDIEWDRKTNPVFFERTQGSIDNRGGLEAYLASYENTWRVLDDAMQKGVDLPKLFFACGKQDHLYNAFVHFREHAEKCGLDATFVEVDGYKHEWRFWDLMIENVLDFFEIKGEDCGNPY